MAWEGLTPPYSTIVADPPWPLATQDARPGPSARRNGKRRLEYSTMTLQEIKALPVNMLAAEAAHLYLWVPSFLFREGVGAEVARAWGFRPRAEIIWRKPGIGMGSFPRLAHEYLLCGVRGQLVYQGSRDVPSVQDWPFTYTPQSGGYGGRVHSAKPPAALDLIEKQSPGPYVELFARQPRLGWDSWGWGYERLAFSRGWAETRETL